MNLDETFRFLRTVYEKVPDKDVCSIIQVSLETGFYEDDYIKLTYNTGKFLVALKDNSILVGLSLSDVLLEFESKNYKLLDALSIVDKCLQHGSYEDSSFDLNFCDHCFTLDWLGMND